MSDQRDGGISWTDETWNVVRGCSRVSEGCANCYAERQAIRMGGEGEAYDGLVKLTREGPRWTGKVVLVEELLDRPARWQRPRSIFVNAMSDLFHEELADESIFRVFKAMADAPQHRFQVLTKRSKRMRDVMPSIRSKLVDRLRHVWMGVSVEHQAEADERIPDLRATPADLRWLSVEPLLGPVDLRRWVASSIGDFDRIDWVVVGGESGPRARPMHPAWARAVRDACLAGGVPFHFKQWGEWSPTGTKEKARTINVAHGSDPLLDHTMIWLGKGAAGRELDGRIHNEFPRT